MILALGLLAMGPSSWNCVGLDVFLFCYTDPLPEIDCCHDVCSVKSNTVIDSQQPQQLNATGHTGGLWFTLLSLYNRQRLN